MNPRRFLLCGLALVAACGDSGVPDATYTARDSAGVAIVESTAPAWAPGRAWTIDATPILEIGGATGDEPYVFSDIGGVVELSDGRIAVADGGSSEIRLFDADGRHLSTLGGRGEGPGEFLLISTLLTGPADSLWAYDFSLRRITHFAPDGSLVATHPVGTELSQLTLVGRLQTGGAFVMVQLWSSAGSTGELGLRRDPVAYARYGPEGAFQDTIGVFPGREIVLTSERGRMVMGAPPFGHTSRHVLAGDHLWVGSQETFEIGEYDGSGSLRRLVRIPNRDLHLEDDALREEIERRVRAVPREDQPGLRAYLEAMPVPDTRPAYLHLLVDAGGHLWVSEYVPFSDTPLRWLVFDPRGVWLGEVTLPSGFRPYVVGSDRLLGVRVDELGVERVVGYRLSP